MKRRLVIGIGAVIVALCLSACGALGLGSPEPIQIKTTRTATALPPFTPRPSDTPWPTFTPMPTLAPVTPGVLEGVVSETVNVRIGPGTNYPVAMKLKKGSEIGVHGRDVDGAWLFLVPPPNGWVFGTYITVTGDLESLPVVEAPPTAVPTPTFAPSPTPQATATPPMYVDFRADAPWVLAGQCTTLRWDVEGVRAAYVDGQGQPGHGSQNVCPDATRTYVLHVVLNSGNLDRAITIAVMPVPATQAAQ